MPYSKLYILTELNANDFKLLSVDRQKQDLSQDYTYGTVNFIFVEIQPYSTNIKMSLVCSVMWLESQLIHFINISTLTSIGIIHVFHA